MKCNVCKKEREENRLHDELRYGFNSQSIFLHFILHLKDDKMVCTECADMLTKCIGFYLQILENDQSIETIH